MEKETGGFHLTRVVSLRREMTTGHDNGDRPMFSIVAKLATPCLTFRAWSAFSGENVGLSPMISELEP